MYRYKLNKSNHYLFLLQITILRTLIYMLKCYSLNAVSYLYGSHILYTILL